MSLKLDDPELAQKLPPLQNPQQVDDLTHLPHLNEPSVLHAIKHRYLTEHLIYTYSGIVLVAINPFARLPGLYNNEVAMVYSGVRGGEPHLFAVAEQAWRGIVDYGANQSIIVSGESGAGSTFHFCFITLFRNRFCKVYYALLCRCRW